VGAIAYKTVVLIGTGRVASGCLEALVRFTNDVVAVEPEKSGFSLVNAVCRKHAVPYLLEPDKKRLSEFFLGIREPALVISAHNVYLFPLEVLENPNLSIVNFHNSLLPRHPGRNAPTWAIYEMDRCAGVTWHQVAKHVDSGAMITQRSIPIESETTALELTRRCADLGLQAFREILPKLLRNDYKSIPQPRDPTQRAHRSTELPNDGLLDLGWEIHRISAFLRSMDYGKLPVLPLPRVRLLGREHAITNYTLDLDPKAADRRSPGIRWDDGRIFVSNDKLAISVLLGS
jgi:methionyl-tRNA formyltransferase